MATDGSRPIAVTLRAEDWGALMDVMDNATSMAVEEGDPHNIVPVAKRVREAASAGLYETDERQLPLDQLTSVELSASDWRYAVLTLAVWAEAGEGNVPWLDPESTESDPDGTVERELIAGITAQLPEGTLGADGS
ncbi:hypothetical protein [Actinoplanes sp. M2I2]|uniref:hypothetical protein n=1 Tax=Actinoplanes sp. M2I2 TaxID=1734444 RepID=UPI002020D8CC|nr:hypothetical protein [Actinoplanes sp. M2I2]